MPETPDSEPTSPPLPDLLTEPISEPAPEPPKSGPEPLVFTGSGEEYFRIWIVNLGLTIVTLGIFSAWAKVRRLQYFYRHTTLAGAGFDYHGNPIAILKGRIVGLILFALYSAIGYVNIWIGVGIIVLLAVLMPWLLGRSMRFRLHNSSYRGIRFRFHGTTKQAYWVFLALPIFTVLSLFTLGPFWHQRLKRYQFNNASYGRTRFRTAAAVGEFYVTYILAGFIFLVMLAAIFGITIGAAVAAVAAGGGSEVPEGTLPPVFIVVFVAAGLAYIVTIIALQAVTTSRIQNECWNRASLDQHSFVSTMTVRGIFVVLFTNLIATVATIGLFRPFAQVRLARYVASTLTFVPAAGFETFGAAEMDDVSAVGEETADIFDFDIAF